MFRTYRSLLVAGRKESKQDKVWILHTLDSDNQTAATVVPESELHPSSVVVSSSVLPGLALSSFLDQQQLGGVCA